MARTLLFRRIIALLGVLAVGWLPGCGSAPRSYNRPTVQRLQIRHHVGGTHYATVMHEAYWYQAFASTIVTIDPTTGDVMSSVEVGEYGESEPVVDLVMHDGRLLALVRNTEVVELVLRNPRRPRIDRRVSASELGIHPHRFCTATGADGQEVFVVGRGGVVRWADQRVFLRGPETYASVASSEYGLVATHGKQVVTLASGDFVGSASALFEMPDADRLIFIRKARSGSLVGMMTPDVREVDAINGTRSIPGEVRAVRFFGGAGWVVGEDRILALEPDGSLRHWIAVKGAMDVAPINENYLAIAGTFGRAVYRIHVDEHGNGDTFVQVTRMPARLVHARTDGRFILAGSDEGSWLYLIGSHADLVNQPIEPAEIPRTAATDTAEAVISADGRELLLTYTDTEVVSVTHREPGDAQMHSVVAVDGEFWVAHDRGITVLYSAPMAISDVDAQVDPEPHVRGRLVLDGPVRHVFPLTVGTGVSFVAEMGGFGVAEVRTIPIDELPPDDPDANR